MPVPLASLEHEKFIRLLAISWPKRGATTHMVSTSPTPVRVLMCEKTKTALDGAKRETDLAKTTADISVEFIDGWNTMTKALVDAKRDAKEGLIKTVVIDPLNFFADRLITEMFGQTLTTDGKEDGRKAHPEFTKRLFHVLDLAMTIPCHLVTISHFMEVGGGDDSTKPKSGVGLVPLMPNMATRSGVAARFHDIVWFDIAPPGFADHYNNRIFVTSSDGGVWGPGCRSNVKNKMIPAHIGKFIAEAGKGHKSNGAAKAPAPPPPAKAAAKLPNPPARPR